MKRLYKTTFLVVVASLFIQACVARKPPYHFAYEEKRVRIKLLTGGEVEMCRDKKLYNLTSDVMHNIIEVPVGKRISLTGSYLMSNTGLIYKSCTVSISFQPLEGESYALDVTFSDTMCYPYVVRMDDESITGVSKVDDLGPKDCFEPDTMY